jgi:hypothetical protein
MAVTINASTSAGLINTADTSGILQLQTANTTALTIDASQNVGLGVTPSAWGGSYKALQFASGAIAGFSTTSLDIYGNAYDSGAGAWKYQNSSQGAVRYAFYNGQHQWYNAPTGTAGNAITFTQAMTLDASGNLLVGTTNGIGKLAISPASGTGSASTWDNTFVTIAPGGTNTSTGLAFSVNTSTNTTQITSLTPGISWRNLKYKAEQHIWEAGGSQTEAARIDSSGNLLVGVTGSIANGSNTASGIQIAKTFMWVANEDASYFQRLNSDGTVQRFYRGANFIGSISVTTTGTVYNTTSDYRLKNVTGTLTGYKERLMSLQPKQGTWKSNGSEFRGFLAHEFAQPYSSSVIGEKDALDEFGNPIYQGMQASSSEVMADLVALVQEQQAIIESLKTRITALEGA